MLGTRAWNPYGRLFFDPNDDGKGGGGNTEGNPPATPPDPLEGLSPEAKAVVQKQIDAAAKAARLAAEKDAKARFDSDAEAKRKADEEERQRQDAIARGEFDKVKTDLEQKLAAIDADAKAAATKLTAYETALAPHIDALTKELPAEALKGYPEEADAVARLAWLQERKELVASLRPAGAETPPKVPGTPRPNGTPPNDPTKDERARRQAARIYTG